MINRFVRLLAVAAVGALGFAPGLRAADSPTAVRFIVGHADCTGGSATLEFLVGATSLGVFPPSNGCLCNMTPMVVSSTDPAVLSAVSTPGCTLLSLRITNPSGSFYLGYARAEIDRTESGTEVQCLVDYAGAGCVDRDVCMAYAAPGTSTFKNGADIDRDGILDSCDPDVDLPGAVAQSIEDGVAWLVTQQNTVDGSWGAYEPVAHTAFAVVKLEERAFELGYAGPFDDAYPYKQDVIDGLNYLFSQTATYGAGTGVCMAQGGHETYSTGLSMMAIAASKAPDRVVPALGSIVDGWTYKEVLQACVDFFAWAQKPDGGWKYSQVWDTASDNSNTGYAVLGLRYAEATAYGFECAIPASIDVGQNAWIGGIQDPVNGDPNDGGSQYTIGGGWVNLLKTGNLLFEMSFVGDTTATQRVKDAIDYIERHWNDPNEDPGWRPHHYQSMYCLMKGLGSLGIDSLTVGGSPVDWYTEFASAILENQTADGYWPADQWGDELLSTTWALLVLEKVAPPPPVDITIAVPDCACDETGYDVTVTYTVERIPVDGTVKISRDGVIQETLVLTGFKGTATYTMTVAAEIPGDHTWKAELDVTPTGGGTPAHADDKDAVKVCETPKVSGIPDQTAPFTPFDLDDYLVYGGGLPVTWSVSGVPAGWTVGIDAANVVTVTPPAGAGVPATLTFTASITCCPDVVCEGSDTAIFTPNRPPDCSKAAPSLAILWPPNNKFVAVQVQGVTDPDGDPITITITSIWQDEKVDTFGDGSFAPDGKGVGTATAQLRAERSGTQKVPGNGRVYHVSYTASDGRGGVCGGVVRVGVPHDVKDTPVDGGPLYDSTALAP